LQKTTKDPKILKKASLEVLEELITQSPNTSKKSMHIFSVSIIQVTVQNFGECQLRGARGVADFSKNVQTFPKSHMHIFNVSIITVKKFD
jgi:hypothetical protein